MVKTPCDLPGIFQLYGFSVFQRRFPNFTLAKGVGKP
jgi:hypothetical protein